MRELSGPQQGDQWLDHRRGRITSCGMPDLMAVSIAKGREGQPLKARETYRGALLSERLSYGLADHYVTPAMEEGSELEDEAKQKFELASGEMLIPCGFILHPVFNWAGASPDALLTDAIYECKAKPRDIAEYLQWFNSPEVPAKHRDQMLWQMRCAEKRRGIFHGYCPRMKHEHMRSMVRILEWDQKRIDEIEAAAVKLNDEIEAEIAKLGLPPTEWLIEDGELALPSKYDPETKLNKMLREAVLAHEASQDVNDFAGQAYSFLDDSMAGVP